MSTPEFGVGDANANCPPGCVMFQNFTQQTACSKKLTKPIILTAYSLVPYVNIHRITTGGKFIFLWRGHRKVYRSMLEFLTITALYKFTYVQNLTKRAISSEKLIFLWGLPDGKGTPLYTSPKPSGSAPASPLIDCVKVLRPTRHKIGHFGDVLPSQSLGEVLKKLHPTQQKASNTRTKYLS